MSAHILLPLANGIEDIEIITLVDVLRRADLDVKTASIYRQPQITTAHGISLQADTLFVDIMNEHFDGIFLAGGAACAQQFAANTALISRLRAQKNAGLIYGAICASAAVVLGENGLLQDCKATCYPTYADKIPSNHYVDAPVVKDRHCITAQAPGSAMMFALTIVDYFVGDVLTTQLCQQMRIDRNEQNQVLESPFV